MHRLLLLFVLFGNIAAMRFISFIFFILAFYNAFMSVIVWPVGRCIGRRWFVFRICWLCHVRITKAGQYLFISSEPEFLDSGIFTKTSRPLYSLNSLILKILVQTNKKGLPSGKPFLYFLQVSPFRRDSEGCLLSRQCRCTAHNFCKLCGDRCLACLVVW